MYECKKGRRGVLHLFKKHANGLGYCALCGLELNVEDTLQVYSTNTLSLPG